MNPRARSEARQLPNAFHLERRRFEQHFRSLHALSLHVLPKRGALTLCKQPGEVTWREAGDASHTRKLQWLAQGIADEGGRTTEAALLLRVLRLPDGLLASGNGPPLGQKQVA